MNGLKDIKPLMSVPDVTIYYFWGLIILFILSISIIFYFLFKNSHYRIKKRKNLSLLQKELALKKLLNLNYKDSKSCVYDFTIASSYLVKNEETKILRDKILKKIDKYKYVRNSPKLTTQIIQMMQSFIKKILK